jgi:recombination protein RecA
MAKKKDKPTKTIGGQSLESFVANVEKKFGSGVLVTSQSKDMSIQWVPTNLTSLDVALGGGIPRGRIIEVYGPESSGKTTLCMHIIGRYQKRGEVALLVDAEYAYDPRYAKVLKVDTDALIVNQPDNGEQALEVVEAAVRSGSIGIVVVDSVAALVPKAEIEGDMGDAHMGIQARMMSQGLRKLTAIISKTDCTVMFINQLRMKIGIMFGNPETTTGGNALKFYASQRLDVRRIGKIPEEKDVPSIGMRQRVKVVKNKVAPPWRETELDMYFKSGYSAARDLLQFATDFNIIKQGGAGYYSYAGANLGQGEDAAVEGLIRLDKESLKAIKAAAVEAATR